MEKRSETQLPNWLDLPEDLTLRILSKMSTIDVMKNVKCVCTSWGRICKDPFIWRNIHLCDLGCKMQTICCKAIDDSNDQLEYVKLECIATNRLLKYIADGCSRLKCLRLFFCLVITDKGLIEAVKKLPLLEELEISLCTNITEKALEVVGSSCPLLKSFKLNRWFSGIYPEESKFNGDALTIAENMHGLHHLQLIGNELTNIGLEAIFDGCRTLETLDLRLCFNVGFEGELRERCTKQIKDLKWLGDPIYEGEFDKGIFDGFEEVHYVFHASSSLQ